MCISNSGIRKLSNSESIDNSINDFVLKQFEKVTDLEYDAISLSPFKVSSVVFSHSMIILDNIQRLSENPMSAKHYFERDVLPALEVDFKVFKEQMKDSTESHQNEIDAWIASYRAEVNILCDLVVKLAKFQAGNDNEQFNSILSTCPGLDSTKTLSYNALKAISGLHSGCTLVGMTRTSHVEEVLSINQEPSVDVDALKNILSSPYFD